MPNYTITSKRETFYSFDIEADSEEQALEKMLQIELTKDLEEYAYEWFPLELIDVEEEEAE